MNTGLYHSIYSEMAADTTAVVRESERMAFEHSIELLQDARKNGRGSRQSTDALFFVSRLWAVLLNDLADSDNALPDTLKAGLISIGIWVLRHAEDIRQGRVDSFASLIEVSETIAMGLRPK